MDIASTYLPLKTAHILLVTCSGAFFGLRGAGVLARHQWPLARPARVACVFIDTLLLIAGISLALLLSVQPLHDVWLGAKLVLLVLYVVLGSFALKRARTPQGRVLCYVAALAVYGHIVSAALMHHPLGMLSLFMA